MADNTVLNANTTTGDTIATEDISGTKYPVSKIYTGAHGVNGGAVTLSNPFPVAGRALPYGADYFSATQNADGSLNVITYKVGGSGGTTVATVTLAYTSGVCTGATVT